MNAPERRPSRWDVWSGRSPLPKAISEVVKGIGAVVLIVLLLAIFVTEGFAVGAVCTVIALLIVIAVKVSHIARGGVSK